MFIGICSRSQVSVYRTIGPLVVLSVAPCSPRGGKSCILCFSIKSLRKSKFHLISCFCLPSGLLFVLFRHFSSQKTKRSSPTLATCETSQVLLAGVSGDFSRDSPVFAPPTDWPVSYDLKLS